MESIIYNILSFIIVLILIYDLVCIFKIKKMEKMQIKFMNKKILGEIVYAFFIVLFFIYLEFSFTGINLRGESAFKFKICWLVVTILLGVLSAYLVTWKIEIRKTNIVYIQLFKKKEIRYDDIASFQFVKNGNIQIVLDNGNKINISEVTQMINKLSIEDYLSKRNVAYVAQKKQEKFTMGWSVGYKVFFTILSACSTLFVIMYIHYMMVLGIVIFGACDIFLIIYLCTIITNKIYVYNDTIVFKTLRKRKIYYLNDIKFVNWSESGTAKYLNICFRNNEVVKINSVWTNFYMLNNKLNNMNVKWKK